MSLSEFSLINKFFNVTSSAAQPALLGIGDDCAVVDVPKGYQLAISTDTLVEGTHFLASSDPQYLGHKALAVNLSDLAAMGATPAWVTLALTIPNVDERWLASFSHAFLALANKYSMQLIGGDTTQGPLSITVTVMGLLPADKRLTRSGAQCGDGVYVTGKIGGAGLGLLLAKGNKAEQDNEDLLSYLRPEPQVELAEVLLNIASACIDVSDGLAADLSHILKASGVGATISHAALPVTDGVRDYCQQSGDWQFPYSSGDDYQLCFTVPKTLEKKLGQLVAAANISRIGEIEESLGLRVQAENGEAVIINKGFEHFKGVM